jgi:hypothetical protein
MDLKSRVLDATYGLFSIGCGGITGLIAGLITSDLYPMYQDTLDLDYPDKIVAMGLCVGATAIATLVTTGTLGLFGYGGYKLYRSAVPKKSSADNSNI